jgi:hypothetical protein
VAASRTRIADSSSRARGSVEESTGTTVTPRSW